MVKTIFAQQQHVHHDFFLTLLILNRMMQRGYVRMLVSLHLEKEKVELSSMYVSWWFIMASGGLACLIPRETPIFHLVPPNIVGEEQNVSALLGQAVELLCQSDAIPAPTLTWLKDGRPLLKKPGLRISENGSVLKVRLSIRLFLLTLLVSSRLRYEPVLTNFL